MSNTTTLIRVRLESEFSPTQLSIIDESHLHVGHAGAKSGKGHYALVIHASIFDRKTLIERHKIIYQALGDLMETHIHAISIKAKGN